MAPWAARKMPGLFTLNERTVLLGNWIHGFFSFAAVGAFNVGSIALLLEEVLYYCNLNITFLLRSERAHVHIHIVEFWLHKPWDVNI